MVWPTLGSRTAKEQNSRALDRAAEYCGEHVCLSPLLDTLQQEQPDFSCVEESVRMTEDRDEWRKYFMVWPTLGSRTADEQNSRACIRLSAYAMSQKRTCVCVFRFYRATLCWRGIRCRRVSVRPPVTSCLSITSRYCIETTGRIELVLSMDWDRWKKASTSWRLPL